MQNITIGTKIRIKEIPGNKNYVFKKDDGDLTGYINVSSEIVALGPCKYKSRYITTVPIDKIVKPRYFTGWYFHLLCNAKCQHQLSVINGKFINQKLVYLNRENFEIESEFPEPLLGFKLGQEININNERVKIIGYNAQKKIYLVESEKGDPLTFDMIEQTDRFLSSAAPTIETLNIPLSKMPILQQVSDLPPVIIKQTPGQKCRWIEESFLVANNIGELS